MRSALSSSAKSGEKGSSYGEILKSSSILGGTQALVYLVSLIKGKAAAVLLGPSGFGLIGLYTSTTSLLAVAAGLGLNSSGVREVADAEASKDPQKVARTILVLRRLSWVSGALGWILTAALAWPLSKWTFGSHEKVFDIVLLGSTVMLGSIAGGQIALLQGMRRIADLAKVNLLCVVAGTFLSISLYALMGTQGIVPGLILAALASTIINWLFSRRVKVELCSLPWHATFREAGPLLRLGLAMTWNGLLVTAVALATRALVVREMGLDASGLYQAAWTISGMFSGFVLGAMSTDFYPRLVGVSGDTAMLKRLFNEQTEVGLLLALPGILGTLVFAPVLLELLYTSKFVAASNLLPWFLVGVFLQVGSWPLGFVLLAKNKALLFATLETVVNACQIAGLYILVSGFKLAGAAAAFAVAQMITLGLYSIVVRRQAGVAWNAHVASIAGVCTLFMSAALSLHSATHGPSRGAADFLLVVAAGFYSLRRLLRMVDPSSRIGKIIWSVPFARSLAGNT